MHYFLQRLNSGGVKCSSMMIFFDLSNFKKVHTLVRIPVLVYAKTFRLWRHNCFAMMVTHFLKSFPGKQNHLHELSVVIKWWVLHCQQNKFYLLLLLQREISPFSQELNLNLLGLLDTRSPVWGWGIWWSSAVKLIKPFSFCYPVRTMWKQLTARFAALYAHFLNIW